MPSSLTGVARLAGVSLTTGFLGLTTVRIPMGSLGSEAARTILSADADFAPRTSLLEHEVIVRSSTHRPGAGGLAPSLLASTKGQG